MTPAQPVDSVGMLNGLMMREAPAAGCCVVGVKDMASDLLVRRLPIRLEGDDRRVIVRPFVLSNGRVRTLFERLDHMDEEPVLQLLAEVRTGFADRHAWLNETFIEHYQLGADLIGWKADWSANRRAL